MGLTVRTLTSPQRDSVTAGVFSVESKIERKIETMYYWVDIRYLQPCQCGEEMKQPWKTQSFLRWSFVGKLILYVTLFLVFTFDLVWFSLLPAETSWFMPLTCLVLKSKCSVLCVFNCSTSFVSVNLRKVYAFSYFLWIL